MLNMPGLKFDKSIKYLENQLNIQTNNKQLILDIITNIGLIINNNSSNNYEELHGVLDIANDFLQDISNNITTLEQLNLEISNITEELNGIMKEQAENTKAKEYYIASLSNIKNHIAQYTEKFQEFQKKLDADNDDFNDFINDNNFKYTFETVEDSDNTDTYELTSFSINDEATIVPGNVEVKNSDKEYTKLENEIEPVDEELVEENEIETIDEEPVIGNEQDKKIDEITNEFKETLINIYNSGATDLDATSIIADYLKGLASSTSTNNDEVLEENTVEVVTETPAEENEIEILTEEAIIESEIETIDEEHIVEDEVETVDEVPIEETTLDESDINEVEETIINKTEISAEETKPVETVIDESIKNVIDIQYIKSLQQNVLSIYNDLSNIADNILNEYDSFPNAFPSFNTNVIPLENNVPVVEEEQNIGEIEATDEIEQPVDETTVVEESEKTVESFEQIDEIDEVILEETVENPIDNLVEETLDLNEEVEAIVEEPLIEELSNEEPIIEELSDEEPVVEVSEEIELPEENFEEFSIEDIFEDFIEDSTISSIEEFENTVEEIEEIEDIDDIEVVGDIIEELSEEPEEVNIESSEEIETIDDIVEDALFNIIEEPTVDETPAEDIENVDTNTECNKEENTDIAYDIIVDDPINNIVEENVTTIEEPTVVEEFEEQIFENKETPKEEQPLLEIEDNFSTNDEVLENTILEETATIHGKLDFEVNNLLDDELNDKLNPQDFSSYHNPVKVVENKKTQENAEKIVAHKPIINENTPIKEIIAHIKKADDANKILLISETANKVYLPYRISELVNYMDYYPNVYKSLQDVVEQEFILDLDDFMKHPARSRFLETYNLIKNRSGKSTMQALSTALKLYKNRFLNPAIVAACKSDYELNCYLDALVTDNLDSFNFFKVVYDVKPL